MSKFQSVSGNSQSRDTFNFNYVRRAIPTLGQAFYFLGAICSSAKVSAKTNLDKFIPTQYATFKALPGSNFDGSAADKKVVAIRRVPIDNYIKALKASRGFRG